MISLSALLAAISRSAVSQLDEEHPQHADLETVARLKQEQRAELGGAPRWVGPDKKRVRWSIVEAGGQILRQYQADPLSASPSAPAGLAAATSPSTTEQAPSARQEVH